MDEPAHDELAPTLSRWPAATFLMRSDRKPPQPAPASFGECRKNRMSQNDNLPDFPEASRRQTFIWKA